MDSQHIILKLRLAVLSFLIFAVWGSYLMSLGNFLAGVGLGPRIGWFYSIQGVVSLFMPAFAGYVADRWLSVRRTLLLCLLPAAICFAGAGLYPLMAGSVGFAPLFCLFGCGVLFFIPTISLSNALIFKTLRSSGVNPESVFPRIRIFGTVGFICAMLFVNFTQFQTDSRQLLTAAAIAVILAVYTLTLPDEKRTGRSGVGLGRQSWIASLGLFRRADTALFFLFCVLIGVALQITNSYGNLYISQFNSLPLFSGTWGARNANALIAVSQVSEALCILLIPFALRRFGIKRVIATAIFAWVLRFALLGAGNTGDGVWMLVLSGIVYGVAFDFFNIAGSVYVDRITEPSARASAQGLFMTMSGGVGGVIGLLAAQAVVNRLVFSQTTPLLRYQGWTEFWYIAAGYALVVALLFILLFREVRPRQGSAKE